MHPFNTPPGNKPSGNTPSICPLKIPPLLRYSGSPPIRSAKNHANVRSKSKTLSCFLQFPHFRSPGLLLVGLCPYTQILYKPYQPPLVVCARLRAPQPSGAIALRSELTQQSPPRVAHSCPMVAPPLEKAVKATSGSCTEHSCTAGSKIRPFSVHQLRGSRRKVSQ